MIKNILIVCLAVGLAAAAFGYIKRGKDLDTICKLSGPHEDVIATPRNPIEQVGNFCVGLQDDW